MRSYAIYRPFRFFAGIGAIPLVLGVALAVRWLAYFLFADDYTSRLPSLIAAITLLLIAGQLLMVAFLADLTATSRRLLEDSRLLARRAQLDRDRPLASDHTPIHLPLLDE